MTGQSFGIGSGFPGLSFPPNPCEQEGVPRICAICASGFNLECCGICKHYFCPNCKRNYPRRIAAFTREHAGRVRRAIGW